MATLLFGNTTIYNPTNSILHLWSRVCNPDAAAEEQLWELAITMRQTNLIRIVSNSDYTALMARFSMFTAAGAYRINRRWIESVTRNDIGTTSRVQIQFAGRTAITLDITNSAATTLMAAIAAPSGAIRPGDIVWRGKGGDTDDLSWLVADGRPMVVAAWPDLFGEIGYTFGGTGSTFYLPDLRGRMPVGAGTGTGLTNRVLGQKYGAETVTLSEAQLPAHTHPAGNIEVEMPVSLFGPDTASPSGAYLPTLEGDFWTATRGGTGSYGDGMVVSGDTGSAGAGESFGIIPPVLALTPLIYTGI